MSELIEALSKVKELRNARQIVNDDLSASEEAWKLSVKDKFAEADRLKVELIAAEGRVRQLAIEQWNGDRTNKKLEGGVGIRETVKLDYSEADAIKWARDNAPVVILAKLDKPAFEMLAKRDALPFVTVHTEVSATIPPRIE